MFSILLKQLQNRAPLASLCPAQIYQPEISLLISDASDAKLFGAESATIEQREMRLACRAGLLLFNDDLIASHNLSQQIETPTGSFWHAIMHRREGDFSNSNYWFLRAGNHPALDAVYAEATSALSGENDEEAREFFQQLHANKTWQPMEFVALCENAAREKRDFLWLQKLQCAEMTALLNWCRERAN